MTQRTFRERLRTRLKHGLMTQELLDRVARFGLRCYPYFLVRERPMQRPEIDRLGAGLEVRFLETLELSEVCELRDRQRDLDRLIRRQQKGNCFGVWDSDRLVAYSWYSRGDVPTASGGKPLCPLPDEYLYLYDAYVCPEYRGRRIAAYMRHKLHEALSLKGATEFVSVTLAFNKSSRRFKSRLGAQETELRLLLTVAFLGGFDMRISRWTDFLTTPRFKPLAHSATPSS